MSKKGVLPITLHVRVSLGGLKNEFFYGESWLNVSLEKFIEHLDGYLVWYKHERIKLSLDGMSIIKHRETLSCVA